MNDSSEKSINDLVTRTSKINFSQKPEWKSSKSFSDDESIGSENTYNDDSLNWDHPRPIRSPQNRVVLKDDDDYESQEDDYYVVNEELSYGYLGLYERSNLGQRLAQSERDLHDQRAFLVSNFKSTLALPTVEPVEEEDDRNDPIVTLEKKPPVIWKKYNKIKAKGRDKINKAILMTPKTKHLQKKYIERRILKAESERSMEREPPPDVTLAEKFKKKLIETAIPNPYEETRPRFWNGTGKVRLRIRSMLNQ